MVEYVNMGFTIKHGLFWRSLSDEDWTILAIARPLMARVKQTTGIEKRVGCGQVEDLIEEARDELTLIGKMIEWDPWGVPEEFYKTMQGLSSDQTKLDEAKATSIDSESKA